MITRQERAKQFMPFDAMKGLQEALRKKEEIRSRVERHGVSDEQGIKISETIIKLNKGMRVWVSFYKNFHDTELKGTLTDINIPFRHLTIGSEKIFFDDLYDIKMEG